MHNEYNKKEKSRFLAYLEILPASFSTLPFNYSKEEREIFKNSFFFKTLLKDEKNMLETFERLKESNIKISYPDFYRLYLTAWTRVFDIYTEKGMVNVMVPYGDMLNTSIDPKPLYYYFDEKNNYIFKALRNIKKGEELFLRYTDGDNTQLLLGFGFTVKNNPRGRIFEIDVDLNLGKKFLGRETKDEEKITISLGVTPSLSALNILKFRKLLEKNSHQKNYLSSEKNKNDFNNGIPRCELIDLKILSVIRDQIKKALSNYQDSKINPEVFEKIDNINLKNIYRCLYEEKRVLENNLFFIGHIVEAMQTKSFYKLETIIDFNYEYDYFYYADCRVNWPRLLFEQKIVNKK
jgi:hypothetical protein